MFWREDSRRIYVLYSDGRWEWHDDTWREGDPAFTCGTQQSPPTPRRGFGKVWCEHDNVRQGLGNATDVEGGERGEVQDFVNGLILRTGDRQIYVLYGGGTWKR